MSHDTSFCFWTIIILAATLGIVVVIFVPIFQVKMLSLNATLDPKDRFTVANEARRTVAQVLGGVAFLTGLYFASRSLSLNTSQERLAESTQLNERFITGVKDLGNRERVVRLAGLRILEDVGNNFGDQSQQYHWVVIDIVAGFVREQARWTSALEAEEIKNHYTSWNPNLKPPTDIQAAVEVIGLRNRVLDRVNYHADLGYSDLRGADFTDFWLDSMEMSGVHFEFTDLTGTHLQNTDLDECHFEGAILKDTDLTGASMDSAVLNDSDLSQVRGLSQMQVNHAIGNMRTRLPPDIQKPPNWR